MRVFAICQDELVIRSLDDVLLPAFEVDFLVESRPLARRLHDAGIQVIAEVFRRSGLASPPKIGTVHVAQPSLSVIAPVTP